MSTQREINAEVSDVFFRHQDADLEGKRIIVHEGSSRSTKTYSIIQNLIGKCLDQKKPRKITIARLNLVWLKATVLPDFKSILGSMGLWRENDFNKTEMIYYFPRTSSTSQFIGLDEHQKLHGLKQDIIWINEAIECPYESYAQLALRTSEQIIFDFNPSELEHWIFDRVLPREDCAHIKSTFRDNPFLEDSIRQEIMRLEPTPLNVERGTADATLWKVYGLGERAAREGLIFPTAQVVDSFPDPAHCKKLGYGLDFGYTNDPTALIKCGLHNGALYLEQKIFERGLTNRINPEYIEQPSIEQRLNALGISKEVYIWADSADPKSIDDLRFCGYQVHPAVKGPDSIVKGIDVLKRYPIRIVKDSVDLIKEKNNYKWKADHRTGKLLNAPVDAFNHGWDAARYWAIMELGLESPDPGLTFL